MEIGDILSLDFFNAYELLLVIQEEYEIPERIIEKIRFGYNLDFDYYNYSNGNFTVKAKEGRIIIENKTFNLKEFYTEIEIRKTQTKRILIEKLTNQDILGSRD